MQRKRLLAVLLLCVVGVLAQPISAAGNPDKVPEPRVQERVRVLGTEMEKLKRTGDFTVATLKQRLLARFPLGTPGTSQWREHLELLLKAAVWTEDLDTRDYHERRSSTGGYQAPEDVRGSRKVYNIDLFNALLGEPRDQPASDPNGKTALMYAAEADRFEVLRTILPLQAKVSRYERFRRFLGRPRRMPFDPLYREEDDQGREYIDWCDKDGYTGLMYASVEGNAEAVNYLLNAGADVENRCVVAQFDALQLAQNKGRSDVVSAIERKLRDKPWWRQVFESSDFGSALMWGFVLGGVSIPGMTLAALRFFQYWEGKRRKDQLRSAKQTLDAGASSP
jgi:hypothetical protein